MPQVGHVRRPGADILALRHFLINRGYHLPPDVKTMGPLLSSALKDWHSGVGHRNPSAWDRLHMPHQTMDVAPGHAHHVPASIDVAPPGQAQRNVAHDQAVARHEAAANRPHGPAGGPHPGPTHNVPANSPHGHMHGGGGGGGMGGGGSAGFTGLLGKLLGHAGTGKMLPSSLADMAAGPDTAAATAVQNEINQLPSAKKQALANIANWYGQVQSSEKTAAGRDQSIANAGSDAMAQAAKGIMASLGGSAMAGSGEIGAMGANDANTMQAIGANDASLAADLAPIFKLAQAGAKGQTQQQFTQGGNQLADELAAAQGQGQADKANALMQILQANNQTRQSNFSNEAGLLNTLAGLQISGMNAASMNQYRNIENAMHLSDIAKNQATMKQKAGGKYDFANSTPDTKQKALQEIVSTISTGGKLNNGMSWPDALRLARNIVRGYGWSPMNPQVGQHVIGPALSSVGITGTGPNGFWPAIFQP